MHSRAADLIEALDLRPHPEGGFYAEIFRSAARVTTDDVRGERTALTTIYFLLPGGASSRWHQVDSDEVWHFYEGDPLELLELDAGAESLTPHRLGPVDGTVQRPVHTLPARAGQAARSLGDYTLVGCTVGPGFDFADFRLLADDAALAARVRDRWPNVSSMV